MCFSCLAKLSRSLYSRYQTHKVKRASVAMSSAGQGKARLSNRPSEFVCEDADKPAAVCEITEPANSS